ncbi:MAG: glutamate synthase subunit alpha, partial [Lentisphaerae bacterium]|nr:glutamate synthase subunit alpha [Lentisphaerota bacterium]
GGKPDHVERFFRFLAQNFRETMAQLGFRTVAEMVGHTERLAFIPPSNHPKAGTLDLSRILIPPTDTELSPLHCTRKEFRHPVACFDDALLPGLQRAIDEQRPVTLEQDVENTDRTVGARLSYEIVKRHGPGGLPKDTIQLCLNGSAGQSLGAFLTSGVTITVRGDVNDYLGKGLAGGRIIVIPHSEAKLTAHENIIAGNVILYGATDGEIFLNGVAGERFAVRNSGARAVVEGVGDHGCEYMTGGVVVVLGRTGNNFAAGMSGGVAYVYDESGLFDTHCNLDMVDIESVWAWDDQTQLRTMIEAHAALTASERAQMILNEWETRLPYFVKVMPIDYRRVLERMRRTPDRESETVSATEEVYNG